MKYNCGFEKKNHWFRYLIGGILIGLLVMLMGCSSKDNEIQTGNTEEVSSNDAEISTEDEEEAVLSQISADAEDNGEQELSGEIDGEEEEIIEQPYGFKFVDVYGEEYETIIKVGFPKTEYFNDCFWFEDERTGYEDEIYVSRQGIDVSYHQGFIDWNKVKAAGIEFAILRIGYRGYGQKGTINLDKEFKQNIENAQAAGVDIGVYFFAQAINEDEAREEADFVLKNLEGYELQLPVVYDPESILDVPARTDDVSGEQFTKNTIVFCEAIKEAGYTPMIYSNMLWEAFEFDMEQLDMYQFWYADYEKFPQTPYAYEIWQYSNEGHVDGINGFVDLDIQFIKK